MDSARTAVGGGRLGRRSQVEQGAGRHAHAAAVEFDRGPVDRHSDRRHPRHPGSRVDQSFVVAQLDDRAADGGVDVAVGESGRTERGLDQVGQHRTDLPALTAGVGQRADFRVRAESGRRPLDRGEFGVDGRPRGLKPGRIGDQQVHGGAPLIPLHPCGRQYRR